MDSRSSRGIQEPQVWAAADQLLAEGLRPTIERVRQKIGSGSPNTVSPMLERWFATLGKRLGGGGSGRSEEAEDVPVALLQAARKLWDAARAEAVRAQARYAEAERAEFGLQRTALEEQQGELRQREAAFNQTRANLEAALDSSRKVLDAMRGQLAESTRLQEDSKNEIRRLRELLGQAQAEQDMLRREFGATATARELASKVAEERHSARERRLLTDVDRERLAARQAVADLAKEQKARQRAEESMATALDAERSARRAEEGISERLRADLGASARLLAQSHAETAAVGQMLEEVRSRLAAEERTHEATRELLGNAIGAKPQASAVPRLEKRKSNRQPRVKP